MKKFFKSLFQPEEKKAVVQQMFKGDDTLPIVKVLKNPVRKLLFLDQVATQGLNLGQQKS